MCKVINYFLMVVLVATAISCASVQTPTVVNEAEKRSEEAKNPASTERRLKGTNTEIMNAFKDVLQRYEFEQFSQASLKIVTKVKKMEDTNPYYQKYKGNVDIYEQYTISMTREEYDMVLDIRYSILVQEMNMKTNTIGFKETVRVEEAENELLKKVKRLLYGA